MIKIVLAFLLLALGIGIGIAQWRAFNYLEKWQLTKVLAYAIMCSLLATVLLVVFVVLF
jgi:hypothetical protein